MHALNVPYPCTEAPQPADIVLFINTFRGSPVTEFEVTDVRYLITKFGYLSCRVLLVTCMSLDFFLVHPRM